MNDRDQSLRSTSFPLDEGPKKRAGRAERAKQRIAEAAAGLAKVKAQAATTAAKILRLRALRLGRDAERPGIVPTAEK